MINETHTLMRKFNVEEFGIREFPNWIVAARGKQVTLGSCVILLKTPTATIGELTTAQVSELPEISKWLEERLAVAWQPDKYNYIAAMMKDPFVHFHVIPRYQTVRTFNGQEFVDPDWPGLIQFRNLDTPASLVVGIAQHLQSIG